MPPKLEDPIAELESKGPRPVYALDGEERLLVDEAVRLIRDRVLPKNARDFNLDVLSGRDVAMMRIIEAAQTLPAFAKQRLVIVDHADKLFVASEDEGESEGEGKLAKRREGVEQLIAYLQNPSPTTVLVFVAEKLDTRTRAYKAIQKAGATIRYNRPKPREMPDFVRRRAKLLGIAIEERAIFALAETVGADATAAIQALEVLALYVGPGKAIAVDDVVKVISTTREESIFAMVDAIGKQDAASALRGLHAMLAVSREHPLRILALIARHYRNLARARSLLDAGVPRQDFESAIGVPPFVLDGLLAQARRQPVSAFVEGLRVIAEADRDLKGGALQDDRAMERLVLRLATSAARR
jgi:DNA polymerase III subunit delta